MWWVKQYFTCVNSFKIWVTYNFERLIFQFCVCVRSCILTEAVVYIIVYIIGELFWWNLPREKRSNLLLKSYQLRFFTENVFLKVFQNSYFSENLWMLLIDNGWDFTRFLACLWPWLIYTSEWLICSFTNEVLLKNSCKNLWRKIHDRLPVFFSRLY